MVITSDFIFASFGSGFIYRFGLSLFSIQVLIWTEWGSSNHHLAYRIPSIGGVIITDSAQHTSNHIHQATLFDFAGHLRHSSKCLLQRIPFIEWHFMQVALTLGPILLRSSLLTGRVDARCFNCSVLGRSLSISLIVPISFIVEKSILLRFSHRPCYMEEFFEINFVIKPYESILYIEQCVRRFTLYVRRPYFAQKLNHQCTVCHKRS